MEESRAALPDLELQLKYSPGVSMENTDPIATVPVRCCISKEVKGSILVLLSAFVFSVMTLFVDAAGEKGIPSFEMMIIRCIFQIIYSSIACGFIGINPFGTKGNRLLPFLRGLFGPLSTGALYYGATKIPIADATVLKFTSPIWTLIIARVVLNETITISNAIAVCVGFTGVVFVAQPQILFDLIGASDPPPAIEYTADSSDLLKGSTAYTVTVLICLCGAVCSSLVYVIIKKSGDSAHFQVLVFYYGVIGVFTSSVLLLVFQGYPVLPADWETYLYLVVISLCGCVAQTMFNKGGQMIDATKTAVFRSTDIAFVLLWQVTLLHEMPTIWSLVGISLVCCCTIIMALGKSKKGKNTVPKEVPIEMENLIVDGECNTSNTDQ